MGEHDKWRDGGDGPQFSGIYVASEIVSGLSFIIFYVYKQPARLDTWRFTLRGFGCRILWLFLRFLLKGCFYFHQE